MPIREVDAIGDAIIATEKEIAGAAWGEEDTDAADETGDRSLEDMGDGLEGQREAEEDDEPEDDDADGEAESEGEAAEAEAAALAAAEQAKKTEPPEGGRVPSGKLREANEAKRAAEAERDALKAELAKAGDTK